MQTPIPEAEAPDVEETAGGNEKSQGKSLSDAFWLVISDEGFSILRVHAIVSLITAARTGTDIAFPAADIACALVISQRH